MRRDALHRSNVRQKAQLPLLLFAALCTTAAATTAAATAVTVTKAAAATAAATTAKAAADLFCASIRNKKNEV